jgi:hypothetical protein
VCEKRRRGVLCGENRASREQRLESTELGRKA